ncbi:aminoacyl-histidine dipeptidase [Proteiniborus sp. MB09-C3]|uniref:aminoacyl-histidine dipeptidase n=1 Tax=Proteiniborus sp. MB09-C3 TaxID=3050072 RepID=UPI002554D33D|nr:aminoacyl-histidine dipeptidase [Proteiniborus sp. MB09-C3]WIV13839.1 aminoacyl-histidine dipeptidase [Proteiniborus sp. MB09-C3]
MGRVLENLEPQAVFSFFEDMTQIPRCSGSEKAISDYLVNFAKKRNLEVIQDKALNVIIKKPGTKGYENAPVVILQGHMDMVCEKNKNTNHDFSTEPLKLRVENDMVMATGTTLGADNGIAVAYALAILDSDEISHPPLEVLITTEEETGMGGANSLDPNNLKGKILINIDSEEEGTLLVSCAGGIRNTLSIPIEWNACPDDFLAYDLRVRGLKGGHSGMEINKERGNSNIILGRILKGISANNDIYISQVSGGAKMNAIPRESDAVLLVNRQDKAKLEKEIEKWNRIIGNELKTADSDVRIELELLNSKHEKVFSKETMKKVLAALVLIPNGVQTMSVEIEGLVQSSTNLGVLTTTEKEVLLECAIRSSVKTLKLDIVKKMEALADLIGAKSTSESDYPAWEYRKDSYIRDIFVDSYKKMYGKEPIITAIHAGLECGLFDEKLDNVDMISLGPNMFDVHTPNERVSISSTNRVWEYLLEVIKSIK